MTADEAKREEVRIMSLPGMQKLFWEKMGPLTPADFDDRIYCLLGKRYQVYAQCRADCPNTGWCSYRIIIPLPIDRDNPERGLAGMLTGYKELHWRDGRSFLHHYPTDPEANGFEFSGDTPTLALLRALERQIGEEVE